MEDVGRVAGEGEVVVGLLVVQGGRSEIEESTVVENAVAVVVSVAIDSSAVVIAAVVVGMVSCSRLCCLGFFLILSLFSASLRFCSSGVKSREMNMFVPFRFLLFSYTSFDSLQLANTTLIGCLLPSTFLPTFSISLPSFSSPFITFRCRSISTKLVLFSQL